VYWKLPLKLMLPVDNKGMSNDHEDRIHTLKNNGTNEIKVVGA